MGLRAFKYYTSTLSFVINKKYKKNKDKKKRLEKRSEKIRKNDQSTQYNEVQKHKLFRSNILRYTNNGNKTS